MAAKALAQDFESFRKDFDFSDELPDDASRREAFQERLASLFEKISAFAVRETKDGAGIDLPSKVYRTVTCDVGNRAGRALQADHGMSTGPLSSAMDCLRLMRLKAFSSGCLRMVQIASNPKLVDESYDRRRESSRARELADRHGGAG
jgi:SNF2 family DNA or RNA helicase